jgi:hypothetical protein
VLLAVGVVGVERGGGVEVGQEAPNSFGTILVCAKRSKRCIGERPSTAGRSSELFGLAERCRAVE